MYRPCAIVDTGVLYRQAPVVAQAVFGFDLPFAAPSIDERPFLLLIAVALPLLNMGVLPRIAIDDIEALRWIGGAGSVARVVLRSNLVETVRCAVVPSADVN